MKKTVLVVDNEPDSVEITSLSLKLFGDWDVIHAFSGAEALQAMSQSKPHIVLLDYFLGDSNGGAILNELQADPNFQDIPVIIYTASPKRVARHPLYREDMHILTKPLNPEALSATLSKILNP